MSAGSATTDGAARARLFFALRPTDREREAAAAAAAGLALGPGARPVPAENFHVTIAFVGEVAADQMEGLRSIGCASRAVRCPLRFDAYEYWPKPEVVVAAARDIPPCLERLWVELHASLAAQGLVLTPKRLRPHVTLARHVSQAPALPALPAFTWTADAFCLMRSVGGGRATYTVVDHWPLLDETPIP